MTIIILQISTSVGKNPPTPVSKCASTLLGPTPVLAMWDID